jgi:hypothetical protein
MFYCYQTLLSYFTVQYHVMKVLTGKCRAHYIIYIRFYYVFYMLKKPQQINDDLRLITKKTLRIDQDEPLTMLVFKS